jgi:hypothetical protein
VTIPPEILSLRLTTIISFFRLPLIESSLMGAVYKTILKINFITKGERHE